MLKIFTDKQFTTYISNFLIINSAYFVRQIYV